MAITHSQTQIQALDVLHHMPEHERVRRVAYRSGLEWWNGMVELNINIVECVLQGERSLLMLESCFLLSFKVLKDHIPDLGGIEAEPFKNCCCGYPLSCLVGEGPGVTSFSFYNEEKRH